MNLCRCILQEIHVLKIANSALQQFSLPCTTCSSIVIPQLEYLVLLFYQELIYLHIRWLYSDTLNDVIFDAKVTTNDDLCQSTVPTITRYGIGVHGPISKTLGFVTFPSTRFRRAMDGEIPTMCRRSLYSSNSLNNSKDEVLEKFERT